MKLEMEGREPYIVLFGIPAITAAIVIGSFYLGRMQSEVGTTPTVHVEPNVTVTPRITAEIPEGAVKADVQVPPAQIHEIVKEVVKVPDVNVVNKVEPTPIQVNVPSHTGSAAAAAPIQFIVIPAPLPVPIVAAEMPTADTGPRLPSDTALNDRRPELPSITPPTPVKPTPVSTDSVPLVEPDVEGKLLPPPRDVSVMPETK